MSIPETIKKAVLPVAGLGTRFLPATKAIPKEMLPIVDTPLVEFAVREAIEAGIEEIIFVTSHTKRSIEDHFDRNLELESKLLGSNKESYLEKVNLNEYEGIKFSFVRQEIREGLVMQSHKFLISYFQMSILQSCLQMIYLMVILE